MSAFIVHPDQVDLLVSAASAWRILECYHGRGRPGWPGSEEDNHETGIGKALFAANQRSVNARYQDNAAAPDYRWRSLHDTRALAPVMVIKACDCFDYQACEVDDYEDSWAAKWIDQLRKHAISKLPGYNDAPWAFTRDALKQKA